ncbi:DUF4386 domain-containing protein [Nonomuraea sp. SBT364]|uniref:DUF4386 domain-containing protein n=1 Tax=Nonomuraea sp. SBT364 TaxID=1580530 RepID=UPI00066A42BD|nr:DUF4386 domain-containing protein [Nonomuraea sp. SBT364]
MTADRRATATAGALIIVGMVAGVLSIVPALEEPNYLDLISADGSQVTAGAVSQLVMIPACVGFALCLYPALRREDEALSLGFVGFRLIAATFHFAGVVILLLFPELGQGSTHAGILGESLRTARDLVNHVALIISLSLGDLLLFAVLHRSGLVPRSLSAWGFLGAGAAMLASFLVLFRLTEVVAPLYLAMNAPLALQNLALAAWLIVRGFAPRTGEPAAGHR